MEFGCATLCVVSVDAIFSRGRTVTRHLFSQGLSQKALTLKFSPTLHLKTGNKGNIFLHYAG